MSGIETEVDLVGFIEKQAIAVEERQKVAGGEKPAEELDPLQMIDPYDAALNVAESFGELVFNDESPLLDAEDGLDRDEDGNYTPRTQELNEQLNGLIDGLVAICDRDMKKTLCVALMMLHTGLEHERQLHSGRLGASLPPELAQALGLGNVAGGNGEGISALGGLLSDAEAEDLPDGGKVFTFEGDKAQELLEKIFGQGGPLGSPGKSASDEEVNEWMYRNLEGQRDGETWEQYVVRRKEVVGRCLQQRAYPGAPIPGGKTREDQEAADLFTEVIAVAELVEPSDDPNVQRLRDMRDALEQGVVGKSHSDGPDPATFMEGVMRRAVEVWGRPDLAEKLKDIGTRGGEARRLAVGEMLFNERDRWIETTEAGQRYKAEREARGENPANFYGFKGFSARYPGSDAVEMPETD